MPKETLTKIGLSPEEAEIYLSLIERGTQSASDIAKNTSIKRTYVYKIAEELKKKGMLVYKKRGRTTLFEPNSPDHLLGLAEKRKVQASEAEKQLEATLKSLKAKYSSVEDKPIVQVYEGLGGLKKVYLDTIKEGETIYAFLQNADMNPDFRQWLQKTYLELRKKHKVKAKVLLASGSETKRYLKQSDENLRETVVLSSNKYPFEVETNIYGNKVAFMNFRNKDNPIGIIIENPAVANSLKAFFKLAWDNTKKNV